MEKIARNCQGTKYVIASGLSGLPSHAVRSSVDVDSGSSNIVAGGTRQKDRNTLEITRLAPAACRYRLHDTGAGVRIPEAARGHGRVYPTGVLSVAEIKQLGSEGLTLDRAR